MVGSGVTIPMTCCCRSDRSAPARRCQYPAEVGASVLKGTGRGGCGRLRLRGAQLAGRDDPAYRLGQPGVVRAQHPPRHHVERPACSTAAQLAHVILQRGGRTARPAHACMPSLSCAAFQTQQIRSPAHARRIGWQRQREAVAGVKRDCLGASYFDILTSSVLYQTMIALIYMGL